ncbi:MAG: hypothetical protein U1F36_05260 [Planctomycetota bacterium]
MFPLVRLVPLAAFLSLLVAPLLAQDQGATEYTYDLPPEETPPPPYDGYTRVDACDVDGDLRADVIALRDGTLSGFRSAVVTRQPLGFQTASGFYAHDFAASDATPQAPTRIYVVGNDGLHVDEYQASSGSMSDTLALTGAWVGAQRVLCAEVDGGRALVGVHADGHTLLYATDVAGTVSAVGTLSLSSAVVDLALLDWQGNGSVSVAVATAADGLLLVPPSGTATQLATSAMGSFLAPLHKGDAADRLCWLHPVTGGFALKVFRQGGSEDDVSLSSIDDPSGMACADLDADGLSDCMITQRASFDAVVLLRQTDSGSPATEWFADTANTRKAFTVWDGTHPGSPLDLAPPAFTDMDRDGHADLVAGLTSVDSVAVKVGIAFDDPNAVDPSILSATVDSTWSIDSTISTTDPTLALKLDVGSLATGMTHVEVVDYAGDFDESLGDSQMESTARSDRYHALHGVSGYEGHYDVPVVTGESSEYWDHGHTHFLEVRFVQLDSFGNLIAATRSHVIAVAMNSQAGEAVSVYMGPVRDHTEHGSGTERPVARPGGSRLGSSVILRRLPVGSGSPPSTPSVGPATRPH